MGRFGATWRRFLQRMEFRTLALIVAAGGAVWAFLQVSDEVSEGETTAVDRAILLWFRTPGRPSDPIGSRSFEEAVRDVTAVGGFTFLMLFVIIVTASLLLFGKWRQAIVLAATIGLAELATDLLKAGFGRDRPNLVPHGAYVYSHSFPSGHSTMSAATFLTVAAILSSLDPRRRYKIFVFSVAILLTLGVGVSRVYLGVHWPTDVLGGWTLGAAWALLARVALGIWRGEAPIRPQSLH